MYVYMFIICEVSSAEQDSGGSSITAWIKSPFRKTSEHNHRDVT